MGVQGKAEAEPYEYDAKVIEQSEGQGESASQWSKLHTLQPQEFTADDAKDDTKEYASKDSSAAVCRVAGECKG